MSTRPRRAAAAATVAVAGVAGLVLTGPTGAAAASGAASVVDRQAVQARLAADGEVESARLHEQLTVVGHGRVELLDPTSDRGLRDLDGFDAPEARDGSAVLDVDGHAERRTVAEHTGDLPVTLVSEHVLETGARAAGAGSSSLADGIDTVRDGVHAVEHGAVRLQEEGTGLIASSADAAATRNARNAALLRAVSNEAEDGALPCGAPDGAAGSAVHELRLAGADTSAQDSTTRAALAVALLGLAGLAGFGFRQKSA